MSNINASNLVKHDKALIEKYILTAEPQKQFLTRTFLHRPVPVLIPTPSHVSWGDSSIRMPLVGHIAGPNSEESCSDMVLVLQNQLHDEIFRACGLVWEGAANNTWGASIRLDIETTYEEEAYTLDIGMKSAEDTGLVARVIGGGFAGLRSGVQTLRQIIRQCAPLLPSVHITDQPLYAVRGYYLDVTRGRVPTLAWLKTWADKLSFYKYNQLQLYIEHSFAYDGLSEAWRGADPLTSSDILEFDVYCSTLGIELVPSVSTFGHHYMALRTRSYRNLGEFPEDADRPFSFVERQEHHTLNITDPKAFSFSSKLIDEYAPLFHSKKFNIGADETFDLGKGRSKYEAKRVGVANMYASYVTKLCRYVSESGRVPMFWGDIAVAMPEVLAKLPSDAILLNWQYSPDLTEKKVKLVADAGVIQYVCPAVHAWNNLLPRVEDAWKNISRLAEYGIKYGAQGIITTDWGDYGHVNDPRMSVPGMVYGAQCSWAKQQGTFPSINQAMSRLEYGDSAGTIVDSLVAASRCRVFGWDDLVRYLELDDGLGGLNSDVAAAISLEDSRIHASDKSIQTLESWRDRVLEVYAGKLNAFTDANERLDRAEDVLAVAFSGIHGNKSGTERAFLIGIEGQRLLNEVGYTLVAWRDYGPSVSEIVPTIDNTSIVLNTISLAGRLERWWEQYRNAWREVSRESELARISVIVWRCADMLRAKIASLEASSKC